MQTLLVSNLLNLFYCHSDSICRALRDRDPATWNTAYPNNKQQINYSVGTVTGTLWGHITKWHLIEYLDSIEPKQAMADPVVEHRGCDRFGIYFR